MFWYQHHIYNNNQILARPVRSCILPNDAERYVSPSGSTDRVWQVFWWTDGYGTYGYIVKGEITEVPIRAMKIDRKRRGLIWAQIFLQS